MKRMKFFAVLSIVSMLVAPVIGLINPPKVGALGPHGNICRAMVIVDRSASVQRAGQVGNVTRELRNLPPQIGHPKINVGFWSFAGHSSAVSRDDNDWNINRWDQNFNWPWHGWVSTTAGAPASWSNAVDTMRSFRGDTLFKRNTYYDWAFGYTNGGNGRLSSGTYNPRPNTALHNTGLPDQSDVLVFTSDIINGEPDQRGNERAIVANMYLSDPNHPRVIVGAIIPAGNLPTNDNPVNLMVNGNRYDTNNVIRIRGDYTNFARDVGGLVKRACDYYLTPSLSLTSTHLQQSQSSVGVRGIVNNNSIGRQSEDTNWRITRIVYPPGPGTNFNGLDNRPINGNSDPCSAVPQNGLNTGGASVNCNWRAGQGPASGKYNRGNSAQNANDNNLPDQVGSMVCYFLSVNPPGFDEGGWNHSRLRCAIVVKSPKVHIIGGDLRVLGVGGGPITSVTTF